MLWESMYVAGKGGRERERERKREAACVCERTDKETDRREGEISLSNPVLRI